MVLNEDTLNMRGASWVLGLATVGTLGHRTLSATGVPRNELNFSALSSTLCPAPDSKLWITLARLKLTHLLARRLQ